MARARWAAAAAATACLLIAAPARAQTAIAAADMAIDVGNAGDLDASFNTDGYGQVLSAAGLQVDLGGAVTAIGDFQPDSQPGVTGTGTAADPYSVVTTFHTTGLQVTETVTHVDGDPRIPLELQFQNVSGAAQTVRAIEWGEVGGGGFAQGTGTLANGYLAGVFPTTASASGLAEVTPWDKWEEADDGDLSTQLADASADLNDTVSSAVPHDPAVGAEYVLPLADRQTKTVALVWRFVPGAAHIDLQPSDGSGPPGRPACFTATVTSVYGAPIAAPVEFSPSDPHPTVGTTADAQGHAVYCATAAEPGEELFLDATVPDAGLDAFSTWTFGGGPGDTTGGVPAPVAGSRLTARVVAGKVRLRHAGRYVALTGARSIRVGSLLDARHGTVELTAMVGRHTQTGRFGAGFLRVRQASASAPVAVALAGAPFGPACTRPGSRKIVRRLRATTARGRWQTVGRRSVTAVTTAASWVTQDRCDGTLTVVRSGTATVRPDHGRALAVAAGGRRLVTRP